MIVIEPKILDNRVMKHEEIVSKLKTNVEDVKRVLSEMDKEKAQHLFDQLAQAGFHEAVRFRKEAKKRVRLARIDIKKQGRRILSEGEKVQELAASKAEEVISQISSRLSSQRMKWRGRRRSN